jgi:PAS domain S-box-containing protein
MSVGHISNVEQSQAPLVQWHEDDERSHVVQFYSNDEFLANAVTRFIAAALGEGGRGLVVATGSHAAAIRAKLKETGLDVSSAGSQPVCLFLDAAETLAQFMVNGMPDEQSFTDVIGGVIAGMAGECGGGSRIAVFGEMVALLWAENKADAAIKLEQLWNGLVQRHSFALRCAYPMQGFDEGQHAEHFLKICDEHSAVIPVEDYSALHSDDARLRTIGFLQQKAQALEKEKREREQAQNSLRLREAELSDLLENAPEGIQRVGADHKVAWANRALLQLLGYDLQEYVGHDLANFFACSEKFDEFWRRLMAHEEVDNLPAEFRCKDGSVSYVLIHSNALWNGDQFVYTRCFIRDVTEQRRAEVALRESEARLRKTKDELEQIVQQRTQALRRLSSHVLGLQDAERRRIARELHDSLGQYLAVLKLNIEMLRANPTSDELLAESEKLTERCISEMRTLSYLLHPPMIDEAGLASAARWYIDGFGERSGTKVMLETNEDFGRLPANMEVTLFRILQEALTNVHRHARASAIAVRISRNEELVVMEIKDNGHGIAPDVLRRFRESGAGTGVGLTGMRERVRELRGELTVQSNENGTTLTVSVPVAESQHSRPVAAD